VTFVNTHGNEKGTQIDVEGATWWSPRTGRIIVSFCFTNAKLRGFIRKSFINETNEVGPPFNK